MNHFRGKEHFVLWHTQRFLSKRHFYWGLPPPLTTKASTPWFCLVPPCYYNQCWKEKCTLDHSVGHLFLVTLLVLQEIVKAITFTTPSVNHLLFFTRFVFGLSGGIKRPATRTVFLQGVERWGFGPFLEGHSSRQRPRKKTDTLLHTICLSNS